MQSELTNRERFRRVLNFEPVDRLPLLEWAHWWDKTIARWHSEGLPAGLEDAGDIRNYFGLDAHRQYWIGSCGQGCPPPSGHGMPIINDHADYERVKPFLYPENAFDKDMVRGWAQQQKRGDLVVWITVEGFFWFPRTLFGIEPHMYAFYDYAGLMKEINEDNLAFQHRVIDEFCEICTPDFMTFAEDMSYNHGPMLSQAQFDEFMAPYYRRIVPKLLDRGIVPFVDTDGDITVPAAWFTSVGVRGLLPLERMAGVDVSELRKTHPKLNMIGAYDKTVMHLGEDRIRQEFERLLPVMQAGGYIPSVDHQTPPEVSIEDYRTYVRVLKEYCAMAVG
ncbi:MAG: uroporphyrinogen decarboxylase family protein [Armatimonadota bacterium]